MDGRNQPSSKMNRWDTRTAFLVDPVSCVDAGFHEALGSRPVPAGHVRAALDPMAFRVRCGWRNGAARMQAAGVIFEEAPRAEPYGTVAVWRDPWGNRWDLIQPAG